MIGGYLVMGVSGSGKSTIAELLARSLGWTFYDADDFHPPANIAKMKSGQPLNDEDRAPWLERLSELLVGEIAAGRSPVLACSALRQRYRDILLANAPGVMLVYLKGDKHLIASRISQRSGHFMPTALLDSQFEALEEPVGGHSVFIANLALSPEQIVNSIPKP